MSQLTGIPYENLAFRARQLYGQVERTHVWASDGGRKLKNWERAIPVARFVRPSALVGREAVMRVVDELVRAGTLDEEFLLDYAATDSLVGSRA